MPNVDAETRSLHASAVAYCRGWAGFCLRLMGNYIRRVDPLILHCLSCMTSHPKRQNPDPISPNHPEPLLLEPKPLNFIGREQAAN